MRAIIAATLSESSMIAPGEFAAALLPLFLTDNRGRVRRMARPHVDSLCLFMTGVIAPERETPRELCPLDYLLVAAVAGGFAGCAGEAPLPSEPSFYRSMALANAELDAGAAASMISGYRKNNGLPAVTLDPELMKLAEAQSRAMARSDKLDHNVIGSFQDRLRKSGYPAKAGAENIGAGYHTLAEAFSGWRDSPPHRANMLLRERNAHGHRRGLRAEFEIQGFLVADPRRAGRAAGMNDPSP